MSFRRGAQQRGNTDVPLVSQPRITGTVRRDSSGEIAGLPLPSTLKIETDAGGPVSVTFSTTRSLNSIITTLTTALAAVATVEDRDGCLSLKSLGSGEGAFISVEPATSGFPDAAPYFGLFVAPHPLGTVRAGDIERAEVRALYEANPEGTAFIAHGADRTPRSFNRALLALSRNSDHLHTVLSNPVAVPVVIDVDPDDSDWATRLVLDSDDNILQIDLSDLVPISESLAGRVWVGNLSASSSLHDIGAYFKVLDANDNEIVTGDRVVRVVAATRGQRVVVIPTFDDEWATPTGPISNTATAAPDGGNALGVNLTKAASAAITSIPDRQTIVVAGATFETAGVVPGDVVTISGSTIDSPRNHNGTYVVEVVVSETQLVVRPSDPEAYGDLNSSGGTLGNCTVRSGGKFQDNIWLSFDPPIPPQKTRRGIGFRLVLGLERSIAALYEGPDALLRLVIRGSAEMDGFSVRDLWNQFNFGGVYDGQAPRTMRGAGGMGEIGRPVSLTRAGTATPAAGSSIRTKTGGATEGLFLTAASDDEFTDEDIGRIFFLDGIEAQDAVPCLATQLDGNKRIKLYRLDAAEGESLGTVDPVDYVIREDGFHEFPAAVQARAKATISGNQIGGFAALHENVDDDATWNKKLGWYGIVAIERVSTLSTGAYLVSRVADLDGDDILLLDFDPTGTPQIFGPENDKLTANSAGRHATLVRVFQGPDAGWYKVRDVRSSGVTADDAVQVVHLDGSAVTFSDNYTSAIGFYNVTFGTNLPTADGRWSAGRFYADWSQSGEDDQPDGVINVGWHGGSYHTSGLKIAPGNRDREWTGAEGAKGWAVHLVASSGMSGGLRSEAHEDAFAFAFTSTPNSPPTFNPSLASIIGGGGLGFFGSTAQEAGRGPGALVLGTFWFGRSTPVGGANWDDSALVVETTAGLGRVAYPVGPDEVQTYLGDGPFELWDVPTRLGHPAVLYPTVLGTTQTANVEPPDSTPNFSMPHSGVLDISSMSNQPAASLLGCRVTINSGADSGKEFRIIAVSTDGAFAALSGPDDITTTGTSPQITVWGDRWREAHADLADWSQIGTGIVQDDPTSLPLETLGQAAGTWATSLTFQETSAPWGAGTSLTGTAAVAGSTVTGTGTSFLSEVQVGDFFKQTAHGNDSWVQVKSVDSNTQLTLVRDYRDSVGAAASQRIRGSLRGQSVEAVNGLSPTTMLTSPNTVGVGRDNPTMSTVITENPAAWTTAWSTDLGEPRAPIPNMGVVTKAASVALVDDTIRGIPAGARILTAEYQGDLKVDDFVLDIRDKNSSTGPFGTYSYFMGGSFVVYNTDGSGTTDELSLWMRGAGALSSQFLDAKARVVAWRPITTGNLTITATLRRSDGTIVATAAATGTVIAGITPVVLNFEFLNDGYLTGPRDSVLSGAHDTQDVHLVLSFDLPSSTRIYFGLITLQDTTRARRHHGPLEVVGAVRAQGYRFMRPVKGFDPIGPERVDLLEFTEYAKQEQTGDNEGYFAYVERQGVGKFFDATPGEECWFQPTFPRQSFFVKGPSAAVVRGTHPFYDPLWYALAANIYKAEDSMGVPVTPAVLNSSLRTNVVWPGRTGFFGDIRAPHGALLTTLHGVLSFLPQFDNDGNSAFSVWNFFDSGLSDLGQLTTGKKSSWDAREGVTIRLWRKHVLDTGIEFDGGTPMSNMDGAPTAPIAGYAEVIWEKDYDLSGVTEPAPTDNGGYAAEHFLRISEDLLSSTSPDSKLRVDLRHFSYSFTVEFWIGNRRIYNDGANDRYYYSKTDKYWNWGETLNMAVTPNFSLQHVLATAIRGDGANLGPTNHPALSPPEAKFRSLRVGWLTDRAGSGWGG